MTAATNALCSTHMHPFPPWCKEADRESSTLFMGVLRRVAAKG